MRVAAVAPILAGLFPAHQAAREQAHRPSPSVLHPRTVPCGACLPGLRFWLGNVSVPLLLHAWGDSPLLPPGADLSPVAHRAEVADYIAKATSSGVGSLED